MEKTKDGKKTKPESAEKSKNSKKLAQKDMKKIKGGIHHPGPISGS